MEYINTLTLELATWEEVQQTCPNTTFHPNFPPEPFAVVQTEAQPTYDAFTQDCTCGQPELVNGEWVCRWTVTDSSSDTIAARRQAAAVLVEDEILVLTQKRLDDFAKTRGYDDIKSLVTYANDPDPVFASEGQYGLQVRSQTWATVRAIRDAVLAGTRPLPSGYAEIEPELPVLVWPT